MKNKDCMVLVLVNNKLIDFKIFKTLREARRFKKMNIKDCEKHGRFDIKFYIDYCNNSGVVE